MSFLMNMTKMVMPSLLLLLSFMLLFSKKNLADSFFDGAKDGAKTVFGLLPAFLLIMCGVSALFSSGAVDSICSALSPLLTPLGIPGEMMPSIVLRPFSGSATTAVADKLFRDFGADSSVSKITSILMGSTDTIIYTLGIYFSCAKIKKTRYALPASFIVFAFSIFICIAVRKAML